MRHLPHPLGHHHFLCFSLLNPSTVVAMKSGDGGGSQICTVDVGGDVGMDWVTFLPGMCGKKHCSKWVDAQHTITHGHAGNQRAVRHLEYLFDPPFPFSFCFCIYYPPASLWQVQRYIHEVEKAMKERIGMF